MLAISLFMNPSKYLQKVTFLFIIYLSYNVMFWEMSNKYSIFDKIDK